MLGTKKNMKKLIIVVDDKTSAYGELLSALVTMKDDKVNPENADNSEEIVGVRDGTVEAVVWTEKVYFDNQATLGSNNKVIFIGPSEAAKPVMANIVFDNDFSPYGVYFGSLGNKAVIYADNKALSNKKTYDKFIDAYSEFIIGVGSDYTDMQEIRPVKLVEDVAIDRRKRLQDAVNKGINAVKNLPNPFKKKDSSEGLSPETEGEEIEQVEIVPVVNEVPIKIADMSLQALKFYVWPAEIVHQVSLGLVKVRSSKGILDQQYRCAVVAYYITRLEKFME